MDTLLIKNCRRACFLTKVIGTLATAFVLISSIEFAAAQSAAPGAKETLPPPLPAYPLDPVGGPFAPDGTLATKTWTGSTSTDFEIAGNWTGGSPANDTTSDIGTFSGTVTANQPTLTISRSINGLLFSTATGGWTLGGAFTLTTGGSGISTIGQSSGLNTISANIALGATQNFSVGTGGSLDISGVVSGAQALTLGTATTGAGTLTLSGANTYTGATTIDAGILNTGSIADGGTASGIGQSTNAAGNLVFGGGTLQYTGSTAASTNRLFTIGDATGDSATLDASGGPVGTLSFTNGGAIAFGNTNAHTLTLTGTNTGINTLAAIIGDNTGATSMVKSGGGRWVLSGSSSYTGGTTVSDGLLQINSSNALGSVNGALQVDGVLNLNGNSIGVGNLSGSSTGKIWNNGPSNAVTFTIGNGNNGGGNYAGVIADNNGAGTGTLALTKTGTGTITLSGANTYTGATTINAGTLNAAAAGALGSTTSITVNSSGTLALSGPGNLNRINNSAGIALGTASGTAGTFLRSGSGTVSEGVGASRNGVTVTGTSSLGLGALTLASNSTLDFGTGGVGTFVFTSFTPNTNTLNILNWNSSATLAGLVSGVDGTDDRLIFQGDQVANLAFISFNGTAAAEILLDGVGATAFYEIVPIPEPATWMGGALAFAALLYSQRKRLARLRRKVA